MSLFLPLNIVEATVVSNPKSDLWTAHGFSSCYPLAGIRGSVAKNAITMFVSEVLYRVVKDGAAEEAPAEEAPKPIKKPGVDPALVEAISASVAQRMSQPEVNVKDTPTVPRDKQIEEAERITRQLEEMDWIGHNRGGKKNHSGWIVALLCLTALVLGALILHSIGAISGRPRPAQTPEETAEAVQAILLDIESIRGTNYLDAVRRAAESDSIVVTVEKN